MKTNKAMAGTRGWPSKVKALIKTLGGKITLQQAVLGNLFV